MDNLDTLKQSLDSLHNKIEDIKSLRIPESDTRPTIIEAKYDSPIPVQFDPTPVIELLDRINRQAREEKNRPEPIPEPVQPQQEPSGELPPEQAEETVPGQLPADELLTEEEKAGLGAEAEPSLDEVPEAEEFIIDKSSEPEIFPEPEMAVTVEEEPAAEEEVTPEELTLEEMVSFEDETPVADEPVPEKTAEKGEELFPDEYLPPEKEIIIPSVTVSAKVQAMDVDISADDLTVLEAEEFINEAEAEATEPVPAEEAIFEEPEPAEEVQAEPALPSAEEMRPGEVEPVEELSGEELHKLSEEPEEAPETKEIITEKPAEKPEEPALEAEEILKSEKEKEKEIEKHVDAEEDANEFELLSEMGKVKDESTLTDEDIFEKILNEDKKKKDDSTFEIIGDKHRDEQEYSLDDSIVDSRMKAEQDFYRKFIKADRIKKRELPILKVSYDFKKLPDEFNLSREKNILEYSFYKYKPMLQKADEFIKHRHVRDAINYYKVVCDQNIPIEFKAMIKRNIRDLTEYLEKYLSSE
jgi:hypothetical protein